jgi:tRNA-dihydrouridine synthase
MIIQSILTKLQRLQDIGVAALSIHARTRAQMYKGHSDWSHIARVKNNKITHAYFGMEIDSPEKRYNIKMNTALTAL